MTLKLRSSSTLLQLTCVAAIAAALTGCSSDASRFGDTFGAKTDLTPTASIPNGGASMASERRDPAWSGTHASAAPIEPHALPAPGASALPMRQPGFTPRAPSYVAAAAPMPASQAYGTWSGQGGTAVTVQPGESLAVLSNRYGVPADAFLHVNSLNSAAEVRPGARLVVPVYGASRAATPKAEPAPKASPLRKAEVEPARQPAPKVAAMGHVRPGDGKLALVKGAEGKSAKPTLAEAKKIKVAEAAKIKVAEAAPHAKINPAPAAQPKVVPDIKKVSVDRDTPTASLPPAADPAPSAGDNPEFRWPAHGRVIQGFKAGANDGINIALPEGTSVKAAEGGVVAYAGSELKGYGNLVLIRHPNGYTSAYANNGEIDVKRGDTIKRGQVIAKSGQSGNVASPQLHFELRKGSTPVDPSTFLAGT